MLYCDSSMQRLFNSKVVVSTKNLASGSWAASILRKAFKLVNWSLETVIIWFWICPCCAGAENIHMLD